MKHLLYALSVFGAICCFADEPAAARIEKMHVWQDGGSIGVEMTAENSHLKFCFDGRLGTETPCRLYVGSAHPKHRGARLLGLGSNEEDRILNTVRDHFDRLFSATKQRELIEKGSYALKSEEEIRGWKILRMVRELERQRKREQVGADQPATAAESKPDSDETAKPESEVRPQ